MHVCECPPGIFIIVKYIISAHCQPHRGFYNNNNIIDASNENDLNPDNFCLYLEQIRGNGF